MPNQEPAPAVTSRLVAVGSLIAGLLLAAVVAAYAATANSSWGYIGPIDGIDYRNKAGVGTSVERRAFASTTLESRDGQVPALTLGARARLFKNGALCYQESNYYYNYTAAISIMTNIHWDCGSGTYASRGVTAESNGAGQGFSYHYTFWTPNINA